MPIGCVSLVAPIITDLTPRRPRKVLDLGIGFGFWGAAVRQWIDMGWMSHRGILQNGRGADPAKTQRWGTYLMGVEGFSQYQNPCWNLYDCIHEMPIQDYLSRFTADRFDAIVFLDVIEHFKKDEGRVILDLCRRRLLPNGVIYVGTPGVWMEQGAAHGNEFERHRSFWTAQDFADAGFAIKCPGIIADEFGNQMILAQWESTAQNVIDYAIRRGASMEEAIVDVNTWIAYGGDISQLTRDRLNGAQTEVEAAYAAAHPSPTSPAVP